VLPTYRHYFRLGLTFACHQRLQRTWMAMWLVMLRCGDAVPSCGTIGTFSRSQDVTRIARTSKTVLQSVCHSVFEPVCLLARHSFIHSFIHSGSRRQRRKLSSYIKIYIHIYLDLSLPSLAVVLVAVVSLR